MSPSVPRAKSIEICDISFNPIDMVSILLLELVIRFSLTSIILFFISTWPLEGLNMLQHL